MRTLWVCDGAAKVPCQCAAVARVSVADESTESLSFDRAVLEPVVCPLNGNSRFIGHDLLCATCRPAEVTPRRRRSCGISEPGSDIASFPNAGNHDCRYDNLPLQSFVLYYCLRSVPKPQSSARAAVISVRPPGATIKTSVCPKPFE